MLSFTGNPLQRMSERRDDEAWIEDQRKRAHVLCFWQLKLLVAGDPPRAQLQSFRDIPSDAFKVFLGIDGEIPYFAADLGSSAEPPLWNPDRYLDMRTAALLLPDNDTAIAGHAKALLDWNARNGFCANCGHSTAARDLGYRRVCPHCEAEHFPRTDPVVIMLPLFGDRCLIGHNNRFQSNRFSAFAGFLEPGETLEAAVRRELREEVGIEVAAVRYHASQPWPFPSSLMLGCYADALSETFTPDEKEIGEARWITREEALRLFKRDKEYDITLPDRIAIAHHLIKDWAEET